MKLWEYELDRRTSFYDGLDSPLAKRAYFMATVADLLKQLMNTDTGRHQAIVEQTAGETRFKLLVEQVERYRNAARADAVGMGPATEWSFAAKDAAKFQLRKMITDDPDIAISLLVRLLP